MAGIYERENARVAETHFQRFEVALEALDLDSATSLLNVWSRNGEAIDFVRPQSRGLRMVNAEISDVLLELARKTRPGHSYVQLDSLSALPFRSRSFDRVLSLETLEHCPDPAGFLAELHRIMRPGGRLVLSCPPRTAEPAYRVYSSLFGGHGEGPHRFLPSRVVIGLLKEAGWRLVDHRGTLLVPLGPRWLRRFGERLLHWIPLLSELGIRQFYVATRPEGGSN